MSLSCAHDRAADRVELKGVARLCVPEHRRLRPGPEGTERSQRGRRVARSALGAGERRHLGGRLGRDKDGIVVAVEAIHHVGAGHPLTADRAREMKPALAQRLHAGGAGHDDDLVTRVGEEDGQEATDPTRAQHGTPTHRPTLRFVAHMTVRPTREKATPSVSPPRSDAHPG